MRDDKSPTELEEIVLKYMPDQEPYIRIYKKLHQNPELSNQEVETSSFIAKQLGLNGYDITTKIGGYGVIGVLRNGYGPSVLLRADMDALPMKEETGLSYASHASARNQDGEEVPVMHACGHDIHMTCMLAVSKLLSDARSHWSGTLICLFQPNEEQGGGAQAMIDDGLYNKVPAPDFILGQHVTNLRSGSLASRPGPFMAAADSFKVTIYGRGGHGSQPQNCVDPILISAYIIVRLQSIVSRRISPLDAAVVTVGSIHGGEGENVIPEHVTLKLNLRYYSLEVRKSVLEAVQTIIKSEAKSAGAHEPPKFEEISRFPVTDNDRCMVTEMERVFKNFFGGDKYETMEQLPGSEDFSNLAKPVQAPYIFWYFGGTDQKVWDDAKSRNAISSLPTNHSSRYAPVIQPTLDTGVKAMSLAALHFLNR